MRFLKLNASKLYLGLLIFGTTFVLKNANLRGRFSQNIVKAMEDEEEDSSFANEIVKQGLDEPSKSNEGTTEAFTEKPLEQEKTEKEKLKKERLKKQLDNLKSNRSGNEYKDLCAFLKEDLGTLTPALTDLNENEIVSHKEVCDIYNEVKKDHERLAESVEENKDKNKNRDKENIDITLLELYNCMELVSNFEEKNENEINTSSTAYIISVYVKKYNEERQYLLQAFENDSVNWEDILEKIYDIEQDTQKTKETIKRHFY